MKAFSKDTYSKRRDILKKNVESGIIVLMGNQESSVNFKDNWYPFRQDSTFLYYIGIDIPDVMAIIDVDSGEEVLFGDDLSIDHIVWTGPQPTVQELASEVGISKSLPLSKVEEYIKSASGRNVHILPPYRPENTVKLQSWLGKVAPSEELIRAVVKQRSIKSKEEVAEIDKAVTISAQMHLEIIKNARPGMKEHELVGMVQGTAVGAGGTLAYPAIITVNGQILHNHYYGNTLKEGDMVLCDTGAEASSHYAGDLTRTFPVSKQFTSEQRDLYQIVLDSQNAAIDMLKPGVKFKDVHLTACAKLVDGLKTIGLMKGDTAEAVDAGAHAMFFQCGLGHLMGLDVHDMEDLGEQFVGYDEPKSTQFGLKSLRLGKELEAGNIVTVEPGIYIIPELIDLWGKEKKFDQFINYDKLNDFRDFGGIRIEDDFVIDEEGHTLLGEPLAKEIKDIEAIREASFS
ncbi:aminopeptidase P family protein [Fulvivirga sediminis]|uniref:Xaa-Pro aminopeptidase n=1 Tax=Fulvivirga sediminis TaxID=2803949 RepID=A0A937JZ03_9BACT|nr:aminopeptidase P family protein [Fulvivirga sediminis]MBL3656933.1 aminopeptidase P family protein [Fulvivirga sediminis]